MALKVIGIGDNVVDKYLHQGMMYPGGNALNFAVYARRSGAQSAFLGAFGDDEAARHVQNTLRDVGVDVQRCRHHAGANGYACIDLVDGDRRFIDSNKGGVLREHPLVLCADDLAYLAGFDLIHTSLNSYLEAELAALHALGVPISFDFSVRGTNDYFRSVCPYIRYGFVSCGHLSEAETKEKMALLLSYGCREIIATRGHQGVYYSNNELTLFPRPEYIKPLDTLGAGDAFLTGFLLSILSHQEDAINHQGNEQAIYAAMQAGHALAAGVLCQYGAFGCGKRF